MCSICILAPRNYFGCQAACHVACHSLLSETAASGRCSFSDDLNFHFSDTSLFILYTRQDREHGAANSHLAIQRSKSQHFSARPHTVIRTEADKYLLKRGEDEEGGRAGEDFQRAPHFLLTRAHMYADELSPASPSINK